MCGCQKGGIKMNGCMNCRYCKCYPGDYWTPDDYECIAEDKFGDMTEAEIDEVFSKVWEDGKEWKDGEEPLCPAWEEADYPEDIEEPEWVWEYRKEMKETIWSEEN